jgi:GntR family transcriptional regulator/MocR family aminotransferase
MARALAVSCRQPPAMEQAALAEAIREGHFERHLRRMRALYGARREALVAALSAHFSDRVTLLGANGGMQLLAQFPATGPDAQLVRRAAALGVGLSPASQCHLVPGPGQGFLLGFSALSPARIREGVRRLASLFH